MTHPARRAVAFLTVFGGAAPPAPEALAWFPAVGAGLGLALGGLWWVALQWWPRLVAAALVIAADLAATGLLHVDGLADSADGLLPHLGRDRRLEVMRQPDVGAFGAAAVGAVLLLRWSALASMPARPLLLGALWCSSRATMAVAAAVVPYARAEGLGAAFAGAASRPVVAVGAALSLALAAGAGWPALVAVAVGAGAGAAVVVAGRRRLGGFTGDVLGAAGILVETVGLAVAAAHWPAW